MTSYVTLPSDTLSITPLVQSLVRHIDFTRQQLALLLPSRAPPRNALKFDIKDAVYTFHVCDHVNLCGLGSLRGSWSRAGQHRHQPEHPCTESNGEVPHHRARFPCSFDRVLVLKQTPSMFVITPRAPRDVTEC